VGTIAAWDAGTRVFTVDPAIPEAYVGGTLRVAGQDWPIAATSGATVTIGGTQPMPMHLLDDDAATHPFQVSTDLLQPVADPSANPFAQAYVLPREWTPTGATNTAPFKRNVCGNCGAGTPEERQGAIATLAAGRESVTSTQSFWSAYIQGSFQHATRDDNDANTEQGVAAFTPGLCDTWGTLIYVEALRDLVAEASNLGDCTGYEAKTATHEVGHQFSLTHSCAGIMTTGCAAQRYFTAQALATIRGRAGATTCDPVPACP
jgi:hypothetical protein